MTKARISVLGLLASAGMLYGCATDDQAASALTNAANVATVETATAATPAIVDNFMLPDETLMGHELYRLADAKAVVIITQANGCPISRSLAPSVRELKAKFEGRGVEFLMLNSALQDSREAILKEATEYNFGIPVLLDSNQLVGEQLGVTRTGEFFVIDPKTWKVVYRGPLDDRRDYGVQKAVATHNWARLPDRLPRAGPQGPARPDLLRQGRGADPRVQVRGLPPTGLHRAVLDDQLRDGEGLLADDPRGDPDRPDAAVERHPSRGQVRG
jgi:thiol-disulfide isomerase/thioredoxin